MGLGVIEGILMVGSMHSTMPPHFLVILISPAKPQNLSNSTFRKEILGIIQNMNTIHAINAIYTKIPSSLGMHPQDEVQEVILNGQIETIL